MNNSKLVANPLRKLFLIDSIGAILSAILLGYVLVEFQSLIGMPEDILKVLAGIASLFFLYSISCFLVNPMNAETRLRTIAIANLLYCLATLILIIIYFDQLTLLGLSYFLLEIIIIVAIARLELRSVLN
ncbi:hypothetical protein SAMN05421640_3163 [Ekhidna lutea]|uniref:Uncharacterized protein n=1 Tax=Ekhidna lutea TaxID=447679 RepID=A0A239LCA7_EKHLU|nr:hypothetical protein [Ekhidna lutea]SNT28287.1 hypothetical protein SAMN05421640_3163 [Ekhidna lutea]